MGDDGYSASQLRSRYGPGGSEGDASLSASQLRSRHGINNREFKNQGGMNPAVIGVAILAVFAVAYYFMVMQGGVK